MPTAAPQSDIDAIRERVREEFPFWAEEFAKIVDKQGNLIPFKLKAGQLELDRQLEAQRADGKQMRAIVLKARQLGFCLGPNTRVLTADLRWVRIDDLHPGDELVATDEESPGGKGHHRRMRRAVVEAKAEVRKQAFRLTMEDGRVLIATKQHRFLCRSGQGANWRRVGRMKPGDVIRHITEPWEEGGFEDGWMGGLYDGEGCFRLKAGGVELSVSQRLNGVFARAKRYLVQNRYAIREEIDQRKSGSSSKFGNSPVGKLILSRMNEVFRVIGQTRPARFVDSNWWEGRELPGKRSGEAWVRIAKVEPLTVQRMVDLQTSTKTFIAEGFVSHNSTYTQGKLIHRCTLRERFDAVVVAQDKKTGAKLYRMGERMYANLPADEELKPEIGTHRRSQNLHFVGPGRWQAGEAYPDSTYLVDTAGEFQAGRGGTYRGVHASEVAFWDQIETKLTSLMAAVPDDPETLFIMESTANGYNAFKDRWDEAVEGRSDWIAFFWPWWKDDEYSLRFASEAEREAFLVGDPNIPYAEEEHDLVAHHGLSLEQLHWRRHTISNKGGGDVRYFHQEYPSTAEEAFIATGQKTFDPYRVQQLLVRVDLTDPRRPTEENPGPQIGDFEAASTKPQVDRSGNTIEVPDKALWTPRESGTPNPTAPCRLWLPKDGIEGKEFIVGADFSGGNTETTRETDYHAIQVIDHQTREQVLEYRSRIEPEDVARILLLVALYFNEAWIAPERTGGWGMPIIRILYRDFHYMRIYRPRTPGKATEKMEARLGWDTTQRTKPELIAGMAGLLKEGEDGIKSRALANEVRTYTRTENGATEAEPGKFDDLLMAYMIAQQVARERPLMNYGDEGSERGFVAAPSSGFASYDPRR
jgi:PAS domain-containing protein